MPVNLFNVIKSYQATEISSPVEEIKTDNFTDILNEFIESNPEKSEIIAALMPVEKVVSKIVNNPDDSRFKRLKTSTEFFVNSIANNSVAEKLLLAVLM